MCGRFTNNAKSEQIEKEFKVGRKNANLFQPRYNIAPSQMIDVVFAPETDEKTSRTAGFAILANPNFSTDLVMVSANLSLVIVFS